MKIIASHNTDNTARLHGSAGGIFQLLAEDMINSGGVVYGVGFDSNFMPIHIRIDSTNEIHKLIGSKYAYSNNFHAILKQVINDLDESRKVLFVGTPCQIAILRNKIQNHHDILLVEVICHGAPDASIWKQYLDALLKKIGKSKLDVESISFRDKCKGWKQYHFTIQFKDGSKYSQSHDNNLYNRAFIGNLNLRSGCYKCPFKYPHGSKADISLGDFWGIESIRPTIDNNDGTTIVISQTARGNIAIKNLKVDTTLVLEEISEFNPAIVSCPKENANRKEFLKCLNDGSDVLKTYKRFAGKSKRQQFKAFLSPVYIYVRSLFNSIRSI